MPVAIVVGEIDVFQLRFLFLLHVAVERSSADDVEQLRAAANAKNWNIPAQRVADQRDFNFVLQGMRFLDMRVIFARGLEMFWLDVLALHEQKASHASFSSRAGRRASLRRRAP